jgi:pimeloyl-ACP methyl ester carboxylesterase
MKIATSRDNTRIAFWRSGNGPSLLLVHGATADHTTTWRHIQPRLEQLYTVYAMDRRGRGGSDDSPEYDLIREAEDIAAVIDSIGGQVDVLGHSFGALCALEAALITENLHRLILYEGVPLVGNELFARGVVEKLQQLHDAGDMEGLLDMTYRSVAGMSRDEVDVLRSQPDAWAVRLRNAPTVPRELASTYRYVFDPARFERMSVPTTFIVGGDSPSRELSNAVGAAKALPDARVVILPGVQHLAMYTAPDIFVRELRQLLC